MNYLKKFFNETYDIGAEKFKNLPFDSGTETTIGVSLLLFNFLLIIAVPLIVVFEGCAFLGAELFACIFFTSVFFLFLFGAMTNRYSLFGMFSFGLLLLPYISELFLLGLFVRFFRVFRRE